MVSNIIWITFRTYFEETKLSLIIRIWLTLSACVGQAPMAGNINTQKANLLVSFTKSALAVVQTDASTTHLNTDFENVKSIISHLTLGMIKLDDITLAITKNQSTA